MKKASFEKSPRVGPGNGESHSTASAVLSPIVYVGDKNCHDVRGPSSTTVQKAGGIVCTPASGSSADVHTMSKECGGDGEGERHLFMEPRSLSQGRVPRGRRQNRPGIHPSPCRTDTGRFWESGTKKQRRIDSLSETESLNSETYRSRSRSPILDAPGTGRRKKYLLEKKEKRGKEAEKLINDQLQKADEERAVLGLVVEGEVDARTTKALNERILEDVAIIVNVATKSGNLKGTFVRALKESAASIKCSVEALRSRSSTEETVKLQEDNSRLQAEVAELRKEMAELKKEIMGRTQGSPASRQPLPERMEVQEPTPSEAIPVDELTRSIMLQVGGMLNARLEAFEERLPPKKRLRPPLAADREGPQPSMVQQQPKPRPTLVKAKKDVQMMGRKNETAPAPLQPQGPEVGWTTVGKRGAKRKKGAQNKASVEKAASKLPAKAAEVKKRRTKQRSPRSAAVVITLQPQAVEKGMTYAKILAEARQNISLADCGISGLRCRRTVTGARIFEVPGATSGEKADTFAEKLRKSLGDDVRVSRPTICSELRIVGLDDSVTSQDVATAIARQGCCPLEAIKVGEVKMDARGSGAVWARCPLIAAKKLQAGGRLLVGWVSASVRLLEPRPMRCYRCLETGHVRVHCTAEVDRSDECYRCGQPGHKAFGCLATAPRCSLCAAASRPAEHRSGDKQCSQPSSKRMAKAAAKQAAAKSSLPSQTGTEEMMITN